MTGVLIEGENWDPETHMVGKRYEDIGRKQLSAGQGGGPGPEPSLPALRRDQACWYIVLGQSCDRKHCWCSNTQFVALCHGSPSKQICHHNKLPQIYQLKTKQHTLITSHFRRSLVWASPSSSQGVCGIPWLSGVSRGNLLPCAFQLLAEFSSSWL